MQSPLLGPRNSLLVMQLVRNLIGEIFFLTIDKTVSKLRIGKLTPSMRAIPVEKGSRDYPGRISIKATPQPSTFRHSL